MNYHLTGKQRLWIAIGVAWILSWAVVFSTEDEPLGPTFVIGVCPVLFVLATLWVRRGFRMDRRDAEFENEVIKIYLKESFRESLRSGLTPDEAKVRAQKFLAKLERDQ